MIPTSSWSRVVVATAGVLLSQQHVHPFMPDSQGYLSRRLGSVTTTIGNGKWQEFDPATTVGSDVLPCSSSCSNATTSEALGPTNTAPWTFNSTNCTTLTVIQGGTTGAAVYTVLDGTTVLGNTTAGTAGDCGDDPTVCFASDATGKRTFPLGAGLHSIRILAVTQTNESDGGWFQINATGCPTTSAPTRVPTRTPTKSPSQNSTKAPTRAPTRTPTKSPNQNATKAPTRKPTASPNKNSTKAPTRKPTASPNKTPTRKPTRSPTRKPTRKPSPPTTKPTFGRCDTVVGCAKKIRNRKLCSCAQIVQGRTQCIRTKAVKVCCPDPTQRTRQYVQRVVKQTIATCKGVIVVPFEPLGLV